MDCIIKIRITLSGKQVVTARKFMTVPDGIYSKDLETRLNLAHQHCIEIPLRATAYDTQFKTVTLESKVSVEINDNPEISSVEQLAIDMKQNGWIIDPKSELSNRPAFPSHWVIPIAVFNVAFIAFYARAHDSADTRLLIGLAITACAILAIDAMVMYKILSNRIKAVQI